MSIAIAWRREGEPTPVFLPGESHGQSSLADYNPWGRRESDTTERLMLSVFIATAIDSYCPIGSISLKTPV